MALRKEKLESFKRQLEERHARLSQGLRTATAEFLKEEDAYTDSVDQASADTDKTLAMQMKNRESATLLQINEAIRRIEAGTFGVCERCSEPISEARLKAFLLTTLCIDCKAELESEEHRFPGRN